VTQASPRPRERLSIPVVIPVVTLLVIALALFLFSRVLLRVTSTAATLTALVVAASILGVATYVASRPQVTGASLLSMVGGVVGIAMLAGGLALLLGQPKEEAQVVALDLAAPQNAAVKGFDTKTLNAPAGADFTIVFDNQDPGVQHNVVVTKDKTTDPTGAIAAAPGITGPAQVTLPVGALSAGGYYFFCEFHPTTMTGTLKVSAAAAPPPQPGNVVIAAQNLAYSPTSIDLPPNQATTVTFNNEDAGTTHNVHVFADQAYTQDVVKGPDVTGVASGEIPVPALKPGTYYFRCDYHPTTMQGTITVAGAGTGGGTGAGGGAPSPTASPTAGAG